MNVADSAGATGLAGVIYAASTFVKTASATDLAAVVGFPFAFIACMMYLFRRSRDMVRVLVFLSLLIVAALLLLFVLRDRSETNARESNTTQKKLIEAVESGCILFPYRSFSVSFPPSAVERFGSVIDHFKEIYQLDRKFIPGKDRKIVIHGAIEPQTTREYALAIGDRRAIVAKEYIARNFDIDPDWFTTASYGKERDEEVVRVGAYMCGAWIDKAAIDEELLSQPVRLKPV